MNGMSGGTWKFKRFGRICMTVNSDDLRSVGKWKYFDVMEFIEKCAREQLFSKKLLLESFLRHQS